MRCEKGKMAIIIKGPASGKVVTCLEPVFPNGPVTTKITPEFSVFTRWFPLWRVDTLLIWARIDNSIQQPYYPDDWMTPLNNLGEEVEDEMVIIMRKKGKLPCLIETTLDGCSSLSL